MQATRVTFGKRSRLLELIKVDCSGRPIASEVLLVAREIGPRAVAYAENLIGDPAIAVDCLEEAGASVSAAMEGFTRARREGKSQGKKAEAVR